MLITEKIQKYLSDYALDAFLVMTKLNRQYVSGFTGSAGVVMITTPAALGGHPSLVKEGISTLYVDDRYLIRARRESEFPVCPISTFATSPLIPLRTRRGEGVRLRIGIEDKITLRELDWLKKTLPGVKFVHTHDVVENLRAVKSAEEMRNITKAQKIIDYIFNYVIKYVRATKGLTEAALALEMERVAKKQGASGMAFDSIVAWGPNAAAPHHLSSRQKIRRNNFLLLDFGVLVNGYHSDFTRTLFIGKPDKKQEKVYNIVLEAQRQGIEKIRAGGAAAEVDQAARGFIAKMGFGKYFTHNTGHGVGLEIHELPNFSPTTDDILKEKMIVTVEPGVYIEKWGGARIEDMVLVERRGARTLSRVPRDLKSMIIAK